MSVECKKFVKRKHNKNVVIKLISKLNITNEDDMNLLVKICGLLEDRNI